MVPWRDNRLPVPLFEVKEIELRPDCRVIELAGELDLAVADEFAEALERAKNYRVILVDLSNCEFVDSTGLAVFVHAHNDRRREDREFALFAATDQVRRVLAVTGLVESGLVFENAEEALEALPSPS